MAPWLPRMHLFEIDDQSWFPPFLRAHVQTGLTHAWTICLPLLQSYSPATLVANILFRELGGAASASRYTYIDFCAGAGGPTPHIERALNAQISQQKGRRKRRTRPRRQRADSSGSEDASSSSSDETRRTPPTPSSYSGSTRVPSPSPTHRSNGATKPATASASASASSSSSSPPSYAAVAATKRTSPRDYKTKGNSSPAPGENENEDKDHDGGVDFILTDLHPHIASWEAASRRSGHLTYVGEPVDASAAPPELMRRVARLSGGNNNPKKVFRLFNLAFHHFDDGLARAILKNTVETSDGFGIFELQDRNLTSFLTPLLFGLFILLVAPLYYWWSPQRLFFVYAVPVIPFVLTFDGLISCLRTRTADEVEVLLRTCGVAAAEVEAWEVRSGSERFLWPAGHLTWVICLKKETT